MKEIILDGDIAEICGAIMGDGNIWTNDRKYEITITASPKDELYIKKLIGMIKKKIKKKVYYRIRGRGLRVTIYSKNFFFLSQKN